MFDLSQQNVFEQRRLIFFLIRIEILKTLDDVNDSEDANLSKNQKYSAGTFFEKLSKMDFSVQIQILVSVGSIP